MSVFFQDLRYTLRQLAKSPGFALTAILTLALGIGANTAVFSTLNALLLKMLPVRDAKQLYTVRILHGGTQPPNTAGTGNGPTSFSLPVFQALRGQSRVFTDVIAHIPLALGQVPVRYGNTPTTAPGEEVSGNFFTGIGVPMAAGVGFTNADEQDHTAKAVVSYGFWTKAFSRDPGAIGQTLYVRGVPLTIVGVTAPGFVGLDPGSPDDFWIPLQNRPELNGWGYAADEGMLYSFPRWWAVPLVVRLAPGVSPEQASHAVQGIFWQAATAPQGKIDFKQWPASLGFTPIRGIADYARSYRDPIELMMALVGLVLLIACTNVALLILARSATRQREFAIRIATGASSLRILRQLAFDSFAIVVAGAGLGWLLAIAVTSVLAHWARIEAGLAPDRHVLSFTLAVASLVAIAFSFTPFSQTLNISPDQALRSTTQMASASRNHRRMGNLVIAFQIAMCFTLLVAAGLTVRTLLNYEHLDLGMQADQLLVFDLEPQRLTGRTQSWLYYNRLIGRLRTVPGVESISPVVWRPGSGWLKSGSVNLDGTTVLDKSGRRADISSNFIGVDFFRTLGVPVLQGREFNSADTPSSKQTAIVNQTFAKQYLPNGALGHIVDNAEIIGVVRDSKYKFASESDRPTVYHSASKSGMEGQITLEIRTSLPPLSLLPGIRSALREIDPNLAPEKPMTQAAQFEQSYTTPMLFARLAMAFGVLAVVLVATGLYGTLTYRLERRRNEIGVRMALGAMRQDVLQMIFGESMRIAGIGFGLGLPLSLVVAHLLRSQLYQLNAFDATSFIVSLAITLLLSIGSALLPAFRAAQINPMDTIRNE
ncbi:ABC transporter permease [Occallatibacter savannae]|uniref:ABC transporter permease n=1 Tax=Occallatibacter savannae TaxID=1002691 RepID=UPI000D698349|nr:ABC transporter permease [Occallatibacter savannae]